MDVKMGDYVPGSTVSTVCRCCLAEGCYKDISTEYFWMGKREVYSEMLSETLNLSIAFSKSGAPNSNSRLICEACISKLRDATDFKKQVQQCEKMFMQHLDPGSQVEIEVTPASSKDVKVECVKIENEVSDDDDVFEQGAPDAFDRPTLDDDDDYDDADDQPLTSLATAKATMKKERGDILDIMINKQITVKRKIPETETRASKKTKKDITKPSASKQQTVKAKKSKGEEPTSVGRHVMVEDSKQGRVIVGNSEDKKERNKNALVIFLNSKICPFRWVKNLYICFYCEQKFSDPGMLRAHNSTNHTSISVQEAQTAISKLKKYELIKIDITDFCCKLCHANILDFKHLKEHLYQVHNNDVDIDYEGLLPFKITKDEFRCAICQEKFDEFKTLNHHMNVHYQNYICDQCGTGFMTLERLRTHSFSHGNGSFPCDSCDKIFKSSNAKNEHFANVHKKVKRHRCPHCSEAFRNYFQRNKHISTVHGAKLKEFKCNLCAKVFYSSGKLGIHVRTVHLKMKRHACDVCEWQFYSKSELKVHMIKHGGDRKFQCQVCKKTYARKCTLREHMRIHDNDRRFVCSVCGKSFVQNCSLKHHFKIHHSGSLQPTIGTSNI